MNWLDEHLVEGWQDSWRWFSTQSLALGGTATAIAAGYPDLIISLAAMMGGTPRLQAAVVAVVLAMIVLRLWNQSEETTDED